ncbi:hypothetical protein [Caballeronia grimmiae]|jgi:hypothetical protein|uniref:hypothetical protein n=1 Tax=Caballeronia grimmiae TaxID=1071679 RepID=UPI0038BDED3B
MALPECNARAALAARPDARCVSGKKSVPAEITKALPAVASEPSFAVLLSGLSEERGKALGRKASGPKRRARADGA